MREFRKDIYPLPATPIQFILLQSLKGLTDNHPFQMDNDYNIDGAQLFAAAQKYKLVHCMNIALHHGYKINDDSLFRIYSKVAAIVYQKQAEGWKQIFAYCRKRILKH
ncbi:MAG: hypothetical protein K6U80_19565 [Firmicutes bacterium]|nr:hypothetical protein [Bacillota bacterium]